MERYIGLDVHAASCTLVVLSSAGRQLRRDVVETNGRALIEYLRQIPGKLHVCLEEGEWSQWLVELLCPRVSEVVVCRPEWKSGSKSDALDARGLAERLRTDQVERVIFKDPQRFTGL